MVPDFSAFSPQNQTIDAGAGATAARFFAVLADDRELSSRPGMTGAA
jgi:hypothetical protein